MPASGGSPSVERETTEFDDWSFELGPHLTVLRHEKYKHLFSRTVGVLLLAFKILKVIEENSSTFSWRTTIPFFGDLTNSVFPSGLVFRLVVESSWRQN